MITCYGWLLFRAKSLGQVVEFTTILMSRVGEMSYSGGMPRISAILGLAILFFMEAMEHGSSDSKVYRRVAPPIQGFGIASMLTVILMGMSNEPARFIYFQF